MRIIRASAIGITMVIIYLLCLMNGDMLGALARDYGEREEKFNTDYEFAVKWNKLRENEEESAKYDKNIRVRKEMEVPTHQESVFGPFLLENWLAELVVIIFLVMKYFSIKVWWRFMFLPVILVHEHGKQFQGSCFSILHSEGDESVPRWPPLYIWGWFRTWLYIEPEFSIPIEGEENEGEMITYLHRTRIVRLFGSTQTNNLYVNMLGKKIERWESVRLHVLTDNELTSEDVVIDKFEISNQRDLADLRDIIIKASSSGPLYIGSKMGEEHDPEILMSLMPRGLSEVEEE